MTKPSQIRAEARLVRELEGGSFRWSATFSAVVDGQEVVAAEPFTADGGRGIAAMHDPSRLTEEQARALDPVYRTSAEDLEAMIRTWWDTPALPDEPPPAVAEVALSLRQAGIAVEVADVQATPLVIRIDRALQRLLWDGVLSPPDVADRSPLLPPGQGGASMVEIPLIDDEPHLGARLEDDNQSD